MAALPRPKRSRISIDDACSTTSEESDVMPKRKRHSSLDLLDHEEDDESARRDALLSPGGKKSDRKSIISGEKPAEVFSKHYISAMKLPDSDPLREEDYILISDPWRQDWEKGVQVPVNPDIIREANLKPLPGMESIYGPYGFKLPKKFLHAMRDDLYQQGIHELHETHKLAEDVCRYDLDDLDTVWLKKLNEDRAVHWGQQPILEWQMEKIIESIETQCHENMQTMIKTVEGLGIEYDENILCDICLSPDSEDNNEMVFCDKCDICVHQACYGIQSVPEGSWLCRTCVLGIKPKCVLCPNSGGAMKSTRSGTKWAHVSCAIWIPEVTFGCVEKMEPICKISHIPSSRWALICSICREKTGSCIQCTVKSCKTAFHVSCAFGNKLKMDTILNDDEDDVQLKAYCGKHSNRKGGGAGDGTPRKENGSPKKECEMTEEEKQELRSHRLKKLEEEFYTCVKSEEVTEKLGLANDVVDMIYAYWVLKRKSNFNKPLLTPKTEEADILSKQQEDSLVARMKMFIHLRQDLERVRNLCYMVSKREKVRRQLYKLKEEIFHHQVTLATKEMHGFNTRDYRLINGAHRCADFYDQPEFILNAAKRMEEREDMDLTHVPAEVKRNLTQRTSLFGSFAAVTPDFSHRGKGSKNKAGVTPKPITGSGSKSHSAHKHQSHSTHKSKHHHKHDSHNSVHNHRESPHSHKKVHSVAQPPSSGKLKTPVHSSSHHGEAGGHKRTSSSTSKSSHSKLGKSTHVDKHRHRSDGSVKHSSESKLNLHTSRLSKDQSRSHSEKKHSPVKKDAKTITSHKTDKSDIVSKKRKSRDGKHADIEKSRDRHARSEERKRPSSSSSHSSRPSLPSERKDIRVPRSHTKENTTLTDESEAADVPSEAQAPEQTGKHNSHSHSASKSFADMNGVLSPSQLVVDQALREKMKARISTNKLQSSPSHTPVNGTLYSRNKCMESFLQAGTDSNANSPFGEAAAATLRRLSPASTGSTFKFSSKKSSLASSGQSTPSNRSRPQSPAPSETHIVRRRIEADLDSAGSRSDVHFDDADGEVSKKSSRSSTPEVRRRRSKSDLTQRAAERHLMKRLKETKQKREMSTEPSDAEVDGSFHNSDSDVDIESISDSGSDSVRGRRTRRRGNLDDGSNVPSETSSVSRYSTRSNASECHQSRLSVSQS